MTDRSRSASTTRREDGDDASVVPVFDGHDDPLTALHWPERSDARQLQAPVRAARAAGGSNDDVVALTHGNRLRVGSEARPTTSA